MKICVFGASSDKLSTEYYEAAEKLGSLTAKNGHTLVFGGGKDGLMGCCALGAEKTGGHITGIAPFFFDEPGILYKNSGELVLTDTMEERKKLMKAYGAELILTDGKLGMAGAIAKANELAQDFENSFIPDQFGNKDNAKAHYETTGPEIYSDTDGKVDIFVAGVGTGGTITGVGRFLKEKNEKIKIVAVEPKGSAVLSGQAAGAHGLQGIGAGFIPSVLDVSVIDEIIAVSEQEAYSSARSLAKNEGILCGISSGAALFAATVLAKDKANEGKNIVVLLPDTGDRYLSTDLFNE